jgi:hypothetical protein
LLQDPCDVARRSGERQPAAAIRQVRVNVDEHSESGAREEPDGRQVQDEGVGAAGVDGAAQVDAEAADQVGLAHIVGVDGQDLNGAAFAA